MPFEAELLEGFVALPCVVYMMGEYLYDLSCSAV